MSLCKDCDEREHCLELCLERQAEEDRDDSANYSKEKYVAKPTAITGYKILGGQYD